MAQKNFEVEIGGNWYRLDTKYSPPLLESAPTYTDGHKPDESEWGAVDFDALDVEDYLILHRIRKAMCILEDVRVDCGSNGVPG